MRFYRCGGSGDVYAIADDSDDWIPCDECRPMTREDYLFEIQREAVREIREIRNSVVERTERAMR